MFGNKKRMIEICKAYFHGPFLSASNWLSTVFSIGTTTILSKPRFSLRLATPKARAITVLSRAGTFYSLPSSINE
jgi:hypothetical protein